MGAKQETKVRRNGAAVAAKVARELESNLTPAQLARARREFFNTISHGPEAHVLPLQEPHPSKIKWVAGRDGKMWTEASLLDHPRFCREAAHLVGAALARDKTTLRELWQGQATKHERARCGWWWCHDDERGREPPWQDLLLAVRALRRSKIDPWGADLGDVAFMFTEGERLAGEKQPVTEEIPAALSRWLAELNRDPRLAVSDWAVAMNRALSEVERLDRKARLVKAGENAGQRFAIRQARHFGWNATDLAAALFLTGADRDRSWLKVRKKVDRMWKNVHKDRQTGPTM